MRVLITHRYYTPDVPPYADMLRDIRAAIAGVGCTVDVMSTQPSYSSAAAIERQPGKVDDLYGRITRIAVPFWSRGDLGKLVSAIWYSFRAAIRVLTGRYQVVMAATTPPVIAPWLVSLACKLRGSAFVYHLQDIHPEILSGARVRNGFFKRVLRWLDRQSCRRATRLVVLSEDMAKVLVEERQANPERIVVINNFFREIPSDAGALPVKFSQQKVELMFAGNIGRFQGLDWVLDRYLNAFKKGLEMRLTFLGDGKMLDPLRNRLVDLAADVRLPGRVTAGAAQAAIGEADVAIISLRKGMSEFAYPSKMMAYACAGVKILAIIEPQSELARFVERNRMGWVVAPGDDIGLDNALADIARAGKLLRDERARIRCVGESSFGKNVVLAKWRELIEELVTARSDK